MGKDVGLKESQYHRLLILHTLFLYYIFYYNEGFLRYAFSEIGQNMIAFFENAKRDIGNEKAAQPKFVLFQGHDMNLLAFFGVFGYTNVECLIRMFEGQPS